MEPPTRGTTSPTGPRTSWRSSGGRATRWGSSGGRTTGRACRWRGGRVWRCWTSSWGRSGDACGCCGRGDGAISPGRRATLTTIFRSNRPNRYSPSRLAAGHRRAGCRPLLLAGLVFGESGFALASRVGASRSGDERRLLRLGVVVGGVAGVPTAGGGSKFVLIYAPGEPLPPRMHLCREGASGMTRPRWVVGAAVLGVIVLLAAGCAKKSTSGAESAACKSDQFGCVVYQKGAPIKVATLLAITGDNKNLGLDSQHGAALAADYLDGSFDSKNGQLFGHDVQLVNEDDGCKKEVGQAGATKIAADPTILSVIGTSCSSSALGVADTILSKKGMLLISPSNTNPNLTA